MGPEKEKLGEVSTKLKYKPQTYGFDIPEEGHISEMLSGVNANDTRLILNGLKSNLSWGGYASRVLE